MILRVNLRDSLAHGFGVCRFPGLSQPVREGAVVPVDFFEPFGVAVQKVIGQVTFLLQQGILQFFRRVVGSHVLVDQGDQERVHGGIVPQGHQAAADRGEHQRHQEHEDAGPQAEALPHVFTKAPSSQTRETRYPALIGWSLVARATETFRLQISTVPVPTCRPPSS